MSESKKETSVRLYKNIIGSTKDTIDAIQKYIENNHPNRVIENNKPESPAESINRILDSVECQETKNEIQKIINNL